MTVEQHRQRLAEAELAKIAALDEAEAAAQQGLAWLEGYVVGELVPEPELRDAQAIAAGGRPLSELTTAEKVRRIAEAKERGITGPDALYTPAAGEPGGSSERPLTANDVAKFASESLEEKVRPAPRAPSAGSARRKLFAI